MSQSSTRVGTYGQTSPQPIVTAQSACSCISTVSRLGLLPERSIPTSRITSTTSGHTCRAGLRAGGLGAALAVVQSRSKNAWAICERPALWVQTNSTYFISPPSCYAAATSFSAYSPGRPAAATSRATASAS